MWNVMVKGLINSIFATIHFKRAPKFNFCNNSFQLIINFWNRIYIYSLITRFVVIFLSLWLLLLLKCLRVGLNNDDAFIPRKMEKKLERIYGDIFSAPLIIEWGVRMIWLAWSWCGAEIYEEGSFWILYGLIYRSSLI